MYATIKIDKRRQAFTLVEMLVAIAIILVIAALAAAFAPRLADDTKLSRAVDSLEQWLLTAKMRAKRDGLATGIRLTQAPGDQAGLYSQVQYIQQPDPLTGGWLSATNTTGTLPFAPPPNSNVFLNGGMCLPTPSPLPNQALSGQVLLYNVDVSLGSFASGAIPSTQWLVQPGDYLELRDGGVYYITSATALATLLPPYLPNIPATLLQLGGTSGYQTALTITAPTTNYRIHRQPRILIGEEPLSLPNNFAIDTRVIPGPAFAQPNIPLNSIIPNNTTITWSNVIAGPSGNLDILFSPSGAVIGSNAVNSMIVLTVYDTTMIVPDINSFISRIGIVAVQTRTGFIGAYGAAAGAGLAGYNPFYLAEIGRESGM